MNNLLASRAITANRPATYALLIKLDTTRSITVGRLGDISFNEGWHCYVGSALNGLKGRVARHLRRDKKVRWHIDYLLEHAPAVAVVWGLSKQRLECQVAEGLSAQRLVSVRGFGASDCRCPSHLFYRPDYSELRSQVVESFRLMGLTPKAFDVEGQPTE